MVNTNQGLFGVMQWMEFSQQLVYRISIFLYIINSMQLMKESRLLAQNHALSKLGDKNANNSNKSNIRSLKAIMNQGRVPLSQYINQKAVKNTQSNAQHLTYFDKLKAMFNKGQIKTNRQKQTREDEDEVMDIEEKKEMEIQQKGDVLQKYLCNFQNNSKESRQKYRMEFYGLDQKERSRSMHGKSRPREQPIKRLETLLDQKIKPKPITQTMESNCQNTYTQLDSIQNSCKIPQNLNIFRGKSLKKQIVNYSKFTSLYSNGEYSVSSIQLDEVLGCGANATVRVGRDKRTGTCFAVKIYQKYKLIEPSKKKRVFRQMQILSKIDHPNIIKVTNSFEDKRQIHILFEFVPDAQTLQDYIRKNGFQLPSHMKVSITKKIAQAISFLHAQGISHRDIKTQNIIVNNSGVVKLIDFGFATTVSKGETHCGTPNYMAPQLFQKKTIYNPFKVDMWALGVLFYYLFEGNYPFKGYNQKDLIKNISSGLINFKKSQKHIKQLISGILSLNPADRPQAHSIIQKIKN